MAFMKNDRKWLTKGLAFDDCGNYEEAIKCYDKALRMNSGSCRCME